jgi:hypothetical protein
MIAMICFMFLLAWLSSDAANDLVNEAESTAHCPVWLIGANPNADFRRDLEARHLVLYAFEGASDVVPGSDLVEYTMCFKNSVQLKYLCGHVCAADSDERYPQMEMALKYAKQYNSLVLPQLRATGTSACSPQVQWSSAIAKIANYLAESSERSKGTFAVSSDGITIWVNDYRRRQRIGSRACAILHKYQLDRDFDVRVRPRAHINTTFDGTQQEIYVCRANPNSRLKVPGQKQPAP